MTRVKAIPGLEVAGYLRHSLHAESRLWVEKNCYVDVFIELLHAIGLEPLAMLGSCAAIDFEGDNFTFYKPSHNDLRALYGLDVQELNVWRPLLEHAVEHLGAGKLISTESDSFYLPDTEGTDYRRNHVKTTIILAEVDVEARRLGYFHNAAYHMLSGDDFASLFRLDVALEVTFLPLFAELVRIDRLVHRPPDEMASMSRALLARSVGRRPVQNPMATFQRRFERDLPSLQEKGLTHYHAWAFATLRQVGATFELLAAHLRWLDEISGGVGLAVPATEFDRISAAAKTFILKAARAVNTRKAFDATPIFADMTGAWERGMSALSLQLDVTPAEQTA